MRPAGIAVLAVLLVASGCAGPLTNREPERSTSSVTPAPVPNAATESPPWIVGGEVDADALVAAHERRLENRSYRATIVWNRTRPLPHGVQRTTIRNRLTVASPGAYVVTVTAVVRIGDDLSTVPPRSVVGIRVGPGVDEYADGRVAYARAHRGEEIGYERRSPNLSRYEGDVSGTLRWALDVDENRVRAVERDGERWYEVTGRERPEHWGLDEFETRVLVSPTGVVRQATVHYSDEDEVVSVEIRFREVGNATVSEPAWLPEARAATD